MGGHSLVGLVIAAVFALGVAAFFAVLAGRLKPPASGIDGTASTRSNLARLPATPQERAAWNSLRLDAEASAAPRSLESLEKSRHARADLLAADPAFDPERFLQRAETAFLLVKRALILGEIAPLRAYVHPSLYALTVAEVGRNVESPVVARAADITVERVFAQSVESGGDGDRIWVHFDIKSCAHHVDAQSGVVPADTGTSTGFGEQCLFVRAAGVKTVVSGGVFAQKCPACGAALLLSSEACCFYCGEEVSTGAHDWTLAAAVPVPYDEADVDVLVDETLLEPAAGFDVIRATDSEFSGDTFMERVTTTFGVLEAALTTGDLERARPFVSTSFYLAWSMQAEEARAAGHTIAIEGTEILKLAPVAVRHGESFDDITLRIEGMRARFVLDDQGLLFSGSKRPTSFSELWTFQRPSDVASPSALGGSERRCPRCGDPVSVNVAGECVHCNATVTSGAFDWVLSRIVDAGPVAMLVRAGAN